jgi:formylmethanofuran dehydrogenase subunit C
MSDRVTLVPKDGVREDFDVEGLTGDRLATLSESAIARLPVWRGRTRAALGDLFDVHGGRSATIHIAGSVPHVHGIGAAMAGGAMVIEGDAGNRVGMEMSGGRIEVSGQVGADAAVAMSAGALHVRGNAGDRLGGARPGAPRGMTGGEIVVHGHAGADAGAVCRRGLIAVGGDAGADAGRAMIAGSVVVLGHTAAGAGRFNKRGSLVAVGGVEVPATYRYACTYRPPHLRVTFRHLWQRYELRVDDAIVNGRYRRYCGDVLDPGKGEILIWDGA